MSTTTTTTMKPEHTIEWVPVFFILAACYVCTLLVFKGNVSDVTAQGVMSIGTTFAGAAGGAYGQRLWQKLTGSTTSPAAQADPPPAATPNP